MNIFKDVSAMQFQPSVCFNLKPETIVLHENLQSDLLISDNNYQSNVKIIDENPKLENVHPISSCILISPNFENYNRDFTSDTKFSHFNIDATANVPCVELPVCNTDISQEQFKESSSNNSNYSHCDKNPYICDICSQETFDQVDFDKHIKMHTDETPVDCDLCQTSFCQADKLVKHMYTHMHNCKTGKGEEIRFMCQKCLRKFPNRRAFISHMLYTHTSQKPFVCEKSTSQKLYTCKLCKRVCKSIQALNYHIKNHKDSYKCKRCNRKFSDRTAFNQHAKMHSRENIIHCDVCQASFCQVDELIKHMSAHSSKLEKKIKLQNSKYKNSKKELTCEQCSEKFSEKSLFISHMYTHTGLKPYMCELCPKTFLSLHGLNYHMKIHKNKCICKSCGQEFSDQEALDKHRLMSTDENHTDQKSSMSMIDSNYCIKTLTKNPYICELCGKEFCEQADFFKHMEMHAGEKALDCDICHASFYRAD